jgi:hypothetical protein
MTSHPGQSSMHVPPWWRAVVALAYGVALFVIVLVLAGAVFGNCAENENCSPVQSIAVLLLFLSLGAGLLIIGVLGWKGWLPGTYLNRHQAAGASLRRSSVTAVVLLTIVTFGFYLPFWFYTRTPAINALASPAKLWTYGPAVLVLFQILGLLAPSETMLDMLLRIGGFVTLLVLSFRVRSIIADDLSARVEAVLPSSLGVQSFSAPSTLLTFFFHIWYLQYKLNELIDQRRAWDTQSPAAEVPPEANPSLGGPEPQ